VGTFGYWHNHQTSNSNSNSNSPPLPRRRRRSSLCIGIISKYRAAEAGVWAIGFCFDSFDALPLVWPGIEPRPPPLQGQDKAFCFDGPCRLCRKGGGGTEFYGVVWYVNLPFEIESRTCLYIWIDQHEPCNLGSATPPPLFFRVLLCFCPEHLTSFEGLTLRFVRYVWYPLHYVTGHGETGYICISRPSLLGHCVRYHCSFVLATSVRIVVCHRNLLIPPVIWSVFDRECSLLPNGQK
jgi:hypothetical protein